MSQSFLNTHILAIMCVDNGATRLLVDGVGTLNVRSDRYMNRSLYICLIFPIFSCAFLVATTEEVWLSLVHVTTSKLYNKSLVCSGRINVRLPTSNLLYCYEFMQNNMHFIYFYINKFTSCKRC